MPAGADTMSSRFAIPSWIARVLHSRWMTCPGESPGQGITRAPVASNFWRPSTHHCPESAVTRHPTGSARHDHQNRRRAGIDQLPARKPSGNPAETQPVIRGVHHGHPLPLTRRFNGSAPDVHQTCTRLVRKPVRTKTGIFPGLRSSTRHAALSRCDHQTRR